MNEFEDYVSDLKDEIKKCVKQFIVDNFEESSVSHETIYDEFIELLEADGIT